MLVGRRGLSPVMIGRSVALSRLEALVQAATPERAGGVGLPSVALVAGEAGVGKSRLLRELAATVPEGTVLLAGQSEPGSLGRPLDLVHSLLGAVPEGSGDPRALAVEAVLDRVRGRRAVIVFEDLHWADSESVAVFELLAAAPLPGLTLVGTYRPDDLTRRLPGGEMLVRLERRHQVHQIHLERLNRYEVGSFLAAVYGRALSTGVVDALWARTGGNPFFLEEILSAAGDVAPEALADQPLPWSLAELVRRQLDGLTSEERRIIEAAAVLGRRAPFDALAALTRCSEDELIGQLRGLVERTLLVEEDDDEFSFRHALVRDAVEGQLLGRQRRRLHEQALAVLRGADCTDLADLARHAAGAGRYDEMVDLAREGVVHYLDRGSSHQALRLAVDALAEAPDDLGLLAGAGRAAWLIGAHDEAVTHASRLLRLSREVGIEQHSAALRLAARVHYERRDLTELERVLDELRGLLDTLPPGEERALALALLAQIRMLQYRTTEAVEWADQAIAEAEAVGAEGVRAQAMVERGSALGDMPDRLDEGRAQLAAGVAEAERLGDWVLAARGLNNMFKYESLLVPGGRERIEKMREAAQRAGFDSMALAAYFNRVAEVAAFDGDLATAHRYLDRAIDHASMSHKQWTQNLRAMLFLEEGRDDEALPLAAAFGTYGPDACGTDERWQAALDIRVAWRLGDLDGVHVAFGRLDGDGFVLQRSDWAADVLDVIEAALAGGVLEADVRAALARHQSLSRYSELEPVFEATIAGLTGDHDAVLGHLEPNVDKLIAVLPAYRRANVRLLLARALAAHSRVGDAREQAQLARADLEQWPGWRREEIDALIRRLDGATSSEAGDGDLTPREREVAALLAEGLSNAELARRLFISPKTAAVHVSNILMKLGMSSRAEVAAWAVRRGLTAA